MIIGTLSQEDDMTETYYDKDAQKGKYFGQKRLAYGGIGYVRDGVWYV